MPYKHQTQSYRDGGEWACWCDGLVNAAEIAADLRAKGFRVKRQKDRVFVLESEIAEIYRAVD